MTDREFALLRFIKEKNHPEWVSILNNFSPADAVENSAIMRALIKVGTLQKLDAASSPPFCRIKLTDSGFLLLRAEEEHRARMEQLLKQNIQKEQAAKEQIARSLEAERSDRAEKDRTDRRFQYKLSFFQALLAFVAGIVSSNIDRIIQLIAALF